MKRAIVAAIFLASFLVVAGCTSERYAYHSRGRASKPDTLSAMKQQDVITMSKAGVSDSLIITMLDASDSWFRLKPQDVVDLKNAGVSDKLINAMIESGYEADKSGETGYRYYTSYYWYPGYYPYWYYPSFYFGYRYYPSVYMRGGVGPHRSYFGGVGYHSGRSGGRRR